MATTTWFNHHARDILIAGTLALCMTGCSSNHKDKPESKATLITTDDSELKLKAHSISGMVGIGTESTDSKAKKRARPIANVVIRAFQWHPKEGVKQDKTTDANNKDQASINTKYGSWQLAGETTTDSKGHYKLEGILTPGCATFVEVISACRPNDPMLPTTTIIADADMDIEREEHPENNFYGCIVMHEQVHTDADGNVIKSYGEICPKGLQCESHNGYISFQAPSKLTKDDRIIYAFRQTLAGTMIPCSIPPVSTTGNDYGVYDGKINPVINIILDNNTKASITPEDWYKRSSYTPIFPAEELKVGTTIFDMIEYLNKEILSGCKDNKSLVKGTIVDLHYYPAMEVFEDEDYLNTPDLRHDFWKESISSSGFNKYDTDVPHYYGLLPPFSHLKRSLGDCYPQHFKEFLLKSGLYRLGNKNEFRDLKSEGRKAWDAGINLQKNNCYQ